MHERLRIALEWLGPGTGRLLDIGCAQGLFLEAARAQGWEVSGCDLNPLFLAEVARKAIPTHDFNASKRWPMADRYFDAIHCSAVIEHVFDYRTLLAECFRCLSPRGRLVIGVPNVASLKCRIELLLGRVPCWIRDYEHIRAWTIARLREEVEPHGFTLARYQGAHQSGGVIRSLTGKLTPTLSSEVVCLFTKRSEPKSQRSAS